MKKLLFLLAASALLIAAPPATNLYTTSDLKAMTEKLAAKHEPFASETLEHYGGHYTMLAYRAATGSSEVHEHEADIFFAVSGHATIVTGGTVVDPHTTKPGEIRGASIQGGEKRAFDEGDVIHISAGVPHQLLIESGKPFSYFVVKVSGQ